MPLDIVGAANCLKTEYPEKHEPEQHGALESGALHVPPVGFQGSAEVYLLEFMREVFYPTGHRHPDGLVEKEKLLDPDDEDLQLPMAVKAALLAARGRSISSRKGTDAWYYAPLYAEHAGLGWGRSNTARSAARVLIEGAFASGCHDDEQGRQELARRTVQAFAGSHASDMFRLAGGLSDEWYERRALVLPGRYIKPLPAQVAAGRLLARMSADDVVARAASVGSDMLAKRIVADWLVVCQLEARLPRLEWIQVVIGFLRLASCAWTLACMRRAVAVHDVLVKALEHGSIEPDVAGVHQRAHKRQLRPSKALHADPFREATIAYTRARIQLSILIRAMEDDAQFLQAVGKPDGLDRFAIAGGAQGTSLQALTAVLAEFHGAPRPDLAGQVRQGSVDWTGRTQAPDVGVGKTLYEFLSRTGADLDHRDREDDAQLLRRDYSKRATSYYVLPGNRIVNLVATLAHSAGAAAGQASTVDLGALARHFELYGIDYGCVPGAKALLCAQLAGQGLLRSATDAGDAALIQIVYRL